VLVPIEYLQEIVVAISLGYLKCPKKKCALNCEILCFDTTQHTIRYRMHYKKGWCDGTIVIQYALTTEILCFDIIHHSMMVIPHDKDCII